MYHEIMETNIHNSTGTDAGTERSEDSNRENLSENASKLTENAPELQEKANTSAEDPDTAMPDLTSALGEYLKPAADGTSSGPSTEPPADGSTQPSPAPARRARGAERRHQRQQQMATTPPATKGKRVVEAKGAPGPKAEATPAATPSTPAPTPAPAAKPAPVDNRPTAVFFLHGDKEHSKWKPGMWQYDLAAVVAKAFNCGFTRFKAADAEYQRTVQIQGAKTNLALAERTYRAAYESIRNAGMTTHKAWSKNVPDDRVAPLPEWGAFINAYAAGAVEEYARRIPTVRGENGVAFAPQRAPKDTRTEDYEHGKDFVRNFLKEGKFPTPADPTPPKTPATSAKKAATTTKKATTPQKKAASRTRKPQEVAS